MDLIWSDTRTVNGAKSFTLIDAGKNVTTPAAIVLQVSSTGSTGDTISICSGMAGSSAGSVVATVDDTVTSTASGSSVSMSVQGRVSVHGAGFNDHAGWVVTTSTSMTVYVFMWLLTGAVVDA